MDIYLAGTAVRSVIALTDSIGNALMVDSLEYDVVDQTGATIVERAPLAGFVPGAESVTIDIPASSNAVGEGLSRASRRITLYCMIAGNVTPVRHLFAIEVSDILVMGVNSFQTYDQAELTALDIPNLTGWDGAIYKDKIAAMVEARARLCQLNYSLLKANLWGQDSLNYVPEGVYTTPYAGLFSFSGDITFLPASAFAQLPPRFLKALQMAQIAETDAILDAAVGGTIAAKRAEGLVEDTVGESKQVFSRGKVLNMGVSRASVRYLAPFLNFNLRTSR